MGDNVAPRKVYQTHAKSSKFRYLKYVYISFYPIVAFCIAQGLKIFHALKAKITWHDIFHIQICQADTLQRLFL